ncbi:anthranilate phosphoribosyltransferase [Pontibacter sp. G13]|uniref:anthranilate phosphoribosyltransferase n=1 Tax=Pontibacter sp. G13 TaxID=3074898 RepID=UPI00288B76CA|nr:anthranilate phosphoribosyltransferase [Pontibacter sp. G13]WNJ21514.1 anthranilate phosphoribosyltransferase [Pontibacter sp. G13]
MKETLAHLFAHKYLTRAQSRELLLNIAKGDVYPLSQVAAFLTVFNMRTIKVEELAGFRDAMLELCIRVDLSAYDPIDLCGTGGDGKNTFNISTLASFIAAGAGVSVAKHGNYGVSSACGSSHVIEYLGGKFTNDSSHLHQLMEESNICFLHAPLFHPAMKHVAPIRRELGIRTFFNMLGPLVNPAFPKQQVTGVFSLELARLYGYLFQETDTRYVILHALDGYDECSLTGSCKVFSKTGESLLTPQDFGYAALDPTELHGGDTIPEAAEIFMGVLQNEGTHAQEAAVLANAGMAIMCAKGVSREEGIALAKESLDSGKALSTFKRFIHTSQLLN